MKVAVVILNWNGKKILEKFLPSVVKYNASFSEVIVADNNSDDDSIQFLKNTYPQIKIIQNSTNGGYAKGYNDALKHVDAEYYVLLNSDVEVTEKWIEPVIELMDKDKNIVACQPKIKDYNNKNLFEYAGAAGGFIDKYGYPFCRGRIFDTIEEDKNQYDDEKEVFWATGACLFVRAETFKKVNGFDEDFFAHMEEIDLCWRLKNLGYKIMYCPQSTIFHVGGGTLNKINPKKTFLNFRNNLIILFKNHSSQYFFIKMGMRMMLDGVAALKFLLSGQFAHHLAVWKAHFSFYSTLSKTLKKRKELKQNIVQFAENGVYRKSLVFDYFVKKKKRFTDLDTL